jgi:hypothetical protein
MPISDDKNALNAEFDPTEAEQLLGVDWIDPFSVPPEFFIGKTSSKGMDLDEGEVVPPEAFLSPEDSALIFGDDDETTPSEEAQVSEDV